MKKIFLFLILISSFNSFLFAQSKVCGYAVNIQDSLAMNNVTIFLYDEYNLALPTDIRTVTNEEGYYEIPDIPFDKYSINAWTPIEFRADTFAYVVQPGVFIIDSTFTQQKLPCFYVNFYFKPNPDENKFEDYRRKMFDNYKHRLDQLIAEDSTKAFSVPDFDTVIKTEQILPSSLSGRVKSVDSLFIPQYSNYVRSKNW